MCIRQARDRLFSIQEFLKAAIFYFVMIVINECFLFSSLLLLSLECYYFIYLFFFDKKFQACIEPCFFVDGPLLGATLYPRYQYSFVILIPYLENDHHHVKRACPFYRRNIPYLFAS